VESRSRRGQRLTDLELAAWQGMLRVSFRLRRELGEALEREHGLSMADYDVLVRLAERRDGAMRMAELADAALQPRSSLTRIVDGLVRRGLVRREPSPEDARGQRAILTTQGRSVFRRAQRTHLDNVRTAFLDDLETEQLRQLAGAWARFEATATH
jgi:DNA-binding MarR family transcriptional regulator